MNKEKVDLKKILGIFINPFISPILASAAIFFILMVFIVPSLSYENELEALEKQALATTTKMKKIRSYYTVNIVNKVNKIEDVKINFDHYSQKNTIPLPATLIHDLSEILPHNGIDLRMFSKYPFPNRADRVLTSYQEKGLEFVEKNHNKVHTQVVKENGKDFLKVTIADTFNDIACVKCHNTRADTPKDDWSLGDVRGALQVSLPIQQGIMLTSDQTVALFTFLLFLIFILGLHYSVVSYSNKKKLSFHNEILDQKINQRTKTLNEYKKAVDSSAIVSKTDRFGKITYVNDQFINISQYTQEELIGANHNIIRDPNMPDEEFVDLWRTIKAKKIWKGQISNRAKDGSVYYVSSTIVPILNSKDEIEEFLAIRLDVSDVVKSKLEAQKANSVKSTFLANISHEIRTPLNAIMGFTQVLSNSETLPPENKKQVKIINTSANNLLGIINDILDISKIENGNFDISHEDTDIHFIAEHIVELFSQRALQKNIKFIFDIDQDIPHCIQTDGARVRQVLSNLLGNSIKFTQRDGEVRLNLKLLENNNNKVKVRFEVVDNGIGIDENSLKKVFEPFVQADDNSNRKYEGTGLGLSICKYIIKSLNGEIKLESKLNEGSKFWFDLEFDICDEQFFIKENYIKDLRFLIDNENSSLGTHIKKYITIFGDIVQENIDIVVVTELENLNSLREKYPDIKKLLFLEKNLEGSSLKLLKNEYSLVLPFYSSKINEQLNQAINNVEALDDRVNLEDRTIKGDILVAEDNDANQELIKYILDELDVQYTIVSDGEEAVNSYISKRFDLVLMDINMPKMDGVDAFKNIRKHENFNNLPPVPIVALTANAIKGDKEKFLALGMDDYLSKPIQTQKLQEVFNKYLHSGHKKSDKQDNQTQTKEVVPDIKDSYNSELIASKLGVSESIAQMLIKKFKAEIQKDLDELDHFISSDDLENISKKAHFIKNSCLNLMLEDSCEILQKIETETQDKQELQSLFAQLKKGLLSMA